VLIAHFLNDKWEPCHVLVGFFEIGNTFGIAMALQLNNLVTKHGHNVHVIAYIKNKRNIFFNMTFALIFIVSCEFSGLLALFVSNC
jgi:hypothetical protein